MKLKSSSILLLVAGCGVFAFFFILQCLHLQRCDYTSDLFSHYQLSHDWLIGKPLFYENCFGFHNKIHNYFIVLFLSPFTYVFGVYGLFVALFGLVAGSFVIVLKTLDRHSAPFEARLLFFIFYCSPLSYFIFHNEHYGFHVETLLIPLSLLFCVTYLQKSKWYVLWAALIILVKEDAVIILWSCGMLMHVKDWDLKKVTASQFCKKAILLSLLCLLVFILGLIWIKYLNHGEETPVGDVLQKIQAKSLSDLRDSFGYLILQRVQLTLLVMFIVYMFAGWKYALAAVLISVPLLIANLLAGLLYFQDGAPGIKNVFSLMWVPRLSMYWAYWFSVLLIAFTYKPAFGHVSSWFFRLSGPVCFGILLFSFQLCFFLHCGVTHFDTLKSITEAFEKPAFENDPDSESASAAAIARQLPANYPVAPMYEVFGAFRKQDIVWLNRIDHAYYAPRMILASHNHDEIPDVARLMKHPMFMLYKEKLYIYTEAEDTSYISKAGIHGTWIDKTAR